MLRYTFARKLILVPGMLLVTSMAFCNLPFGSNAPTPTMNVTQAYQTVEAKLSQAVSQPPATTEQATATTTPTSGPNPSSTSDRPPAPTASTAPPSTQPPSQSCDRAAAGNPIDVTVPDDTVMQPGQTFTKIWRLENAGTCTWTNQYSVTYFSGEQMGAPVNVPLRGDVKPGQTVDITVDMVAPIQAGKYQGNWKLRNASSVLFGIGPGGTSPFWVRIIVEETPTASPTAGTATPTLTPTSTPPPVLASGRAFLNVGDKIDLETLGVNSGSGEDLSYESDTDGKHPLIPLVGTLIGQYGNDQPTLALCQQANLSPAPIIIDELPVGTYLCYRTNQGLPGWARIVNLNIDNFILTLDLLTWSLP